MLSAIACACDRTAASGAQNVFRAHFLLPPLNAGWLFADHADPFSGLADIPAGERFCRLGCQRRRIVGSPREAPSRRHGSLDSGGRRSFRHFGRHRKDIGLQQLRLFGLRLLRRPVPKPPDIERPWNDDGAVVAARAAAPQQQHRAKEKRQDPSQHRQHPCGIYNAASVLPTTVGIHRGQG